MTICYLEGKFLPAERAKVSTTELEIRCGLVVFKRLRTYNRRPFALLEHLGRLERSACRTKWDSLTRTRRSLE